MIHLRDISKEYRLTCWVYFGIVERVKLSSEEIVEEYGRIEWRLWIHERDARRKIPASRVYEEKLATEVGSSISHLNVVR